MMKSLNASKILAGFECTCGKFHEFAPWVYAHWDADIRVICECGQSWRIMNGYATMIGMRVHKAIKRTR